MAYNIYTASRVRDYLSHYPNLLIEEKKMFGGVAFIVNGKMCVNISGENLMCRFDPDRQEELSHKAGYQKVVMRGREYKGYCFVNPQGYEHEDEFRYWVNLCLAFNEKAKSSKGKDKLNFG